MTRLSKVKQSIHEHKDKRQIMQPKKTQRQTLGPTVYTKLYTVTSF